MLLPLIYELYLFHDDLWPNLYKTTKRLTIGPRCYNPRRRQKNKSHSDQMFNTEIDHSTFTNSTPNPLINIPALPPVHNIVNTTPEESLGQTERGEAAIAKEQDSYRLD